MLRFTPALWRYRWLILSITLAGLGAGWSALGLIEPRYEARATVLVQAVEAPGARPLRPEDPLSSRSLQELLKTGLVLAPVVNEFHLAHGSDAGSEWEAVESLAERLRVWQDDSGDLLNVSLVGSDPEQTTTVLNAVVARFVSAAVDLKREKLSALAGILEQQRVRAQQWLREAEEELERFRLQYPPSVPRVPAGLADTQDTVLTIYWTLKREQDQLRAERSALEEASKEDPDSGLQALLDDLRARESALERRLAFAERLVLTIPPRSIEEEALERRVATAERFYNELQMRHESALLAAAGSMADLRLLEPAVTPARPLRSGSPLSFLVLVIVISLCVAVADALLLDWLDRKTENAYRL
jgi:uncharacterized protein involved in exopolysaccharide biosynthesis